MNDKHTEPDQDPMDDPLDIKGTGALCPEAQADGVPCQDVGKDCAICGKADESLPPKAPVQDGF